ncbi:hypothetical protein TNCV_894991 [Trichonephila clavipes]|nr:hypothetical protein TNCV_894991 [Trichonephila clavipes]
MVRFSCPSSEKAGKRVEMIRFMILLKSTRERDEASNRKRGPRTSWPRSRILFRDEAHFCLNGYVNKQKCRIWSEANPQVYVETPLHPETLTVWCALWGGGILLQKR